MFPTPSVTATGPIDHRLATKSKLRIEPNDSTIGDTEPPGAESESEKADASAYTAVSPTNGMIQQPTEWPVSTFNVEQPMREPSGAAIVATVATEPSFVQLDTAEILTSWDVLELALNVNEKLFENTPIPEMVPP